MDKTQLERLLISGSGHDPDEQDYDPMHFDEVYTAVNFYEENCVWEKVKQWRGEPEKQEISIDEIINGTDDLTPLKRARQLFCTEDKSNEYDPRYLKWRQRALNSSILNDYTYVTEDRKEVELTHLGTLAERMFAIVDRFKSLIRDGAVCQIGWSNGKDSNVLALLYSYAIYELYAEGFKPKTKSILVHSDTLSEMPEISNTAKQNWDGLFSDSVFNEYTHMVLAKPNFSETLVGRICSGRGLPTTVSSNVRQCAMDRKVLPIRRAIRKACKRLGITNSDKIIVCLGSRDEEGTLRAASIAKHGGSDDNLAISQEGNTNRYNFYPIKHMTTSDIWTILGSAGTDASKTLPSPINYEAISKIYADSAGECNLFATASTEKAKSKPCQSRHGCWDCQAVGLEDKSMTNLVVKDEYKHLELLSRIRDFIAYRHYDWSERVNINRGIDKFGFAKIQPDLYNFAKCRKIFKAIVTADYIEEMRATHLALQIKWGYAEDTSYNREMARPQFKHVDEETVLKLDFLWSFHNFSDHPNEALMVWDEVRNHGDLEILEEMTTMEPVPRTPQPAPHYIYVGKDWTDNQENLGLVDVMAEFVDLQAWENDAQYRVPRTRKSDGIEYHYSTMHLETSKLLSVDREQMYFYFSDIARYRYPNPLDSSLSAAMSYLRSGAITIAKGKQYTYHLMATRRQWWERRQLSGNRSLEEILARKDELGILDKEEYKKFVLENFSEAEFDAEQALDKVDDEYWYIEQLSMDFGEDVSTPTESAMIKVKKKQSSPKRKPTKSKKELLQEELNDRTLSMF
ncbi:hypothetical protein A6E01_19030 (plasmid) [Vibrio breoganii]|uniref:Phosphoadenosine phosphosulphate reductase domain-containing protein n=2 Tax=Vibrio TaxID=662 RepID=A0AAN0XZ98_9VIBR|nr:phosphoadenosine phosphosulfate reductase family protein [Vibrio breoganii]ANO35308.1 hypothetical protein A6E01_19030 [Vibrio breoganii]